MVKGQGKKWNLSLAENVDANAKGSVRGYQFKSEGKGEPKKNPPAYRPLDDGKEKLAEAQMPSPDIDAHDMEQLGFAEKE